jgi:hypothetical protein
MKEGKIGSMLDLVDVEFMAQNVLTFLKIFRWGGRG